MITLLYTDDAGAVQEVSFDVTLNEKHETTLTVTDHPVETGTEITDHIQRQPARLTFDAVVSNTPIRVPTTQARGVAGSVKELDLGQKQTFGAKSANTLQFNKEFDRVVDVYELLRTLQRDGQFFEIVSPLQKYQDMVLEKISAPRTVELGTAIQFTLEFRQIFTAESQTVAAPEPRQQRARARQDRGPVHADENAEPPQRPGHQSILSRILG